MVLEFWKVSQIQFPGTMASGRAKRFGRRSSAVADQQGTGRDHVQDQNTGTPEQCYHDEHLDFDFENKRLLLDTKPLRLNPKKYDLLALLIRNAGELVTRETLLMCVWGYSNDVCTRTLDVHIRRLRKMMGDHSRTYIETIFGVGYRFRPFTKPRRIPPDDGKIPKAAGNSKPTL
jgi:DNA-binding response OmpR family regulator